jgi:hypothetical protein
MISLIRIYFTPDEIDYLQACQTACSIARQHDSRVIFCWQTGTISRETEVYPHDTPAKLILKSCIERNDKQRIPIARG